MDGVGEWSTTSFGVGKDNSLQILADIQFLIPWVYCIQQ